MEKKQKNHGFGTNCAFGRGRKMMGFERTVDLKLKDYIGKRQKNYGVGTKCVFGRRGKTSGIRQ